MGCPSCGGIRSSTGGCLNPCCPSKAMTPAPFAAVGRTIPAPPLTLQTTAVRIAELEEALRRYGRHSPYCDGPCICGLDEVSRHRETGP